MADRDAWEQLLYRFAAILLRNEAFAREVTLATLKGALKKVPLHADADRFAIFLFQDIRRRALKILPASTAPLPVRGVLPSGEVKPAPGADRIEAALHALPEPGRTALSLLLLDAIESDHIARLLGLDRARFADAVHGARLALHQALLAAPTGAAS